MNSSNDLVIKQTVQYLNDFIIPFYDRNKSPLIWATYVNVLKEVCRDRKSSTIENHNLVMDAINEYLENGYRIGFDNKNNYGAEKRSNSIMFLRKSPVIAAIVLSIAILIAAVLFFQANRYSHVTGFLYLDKLKGEMVVFPRASNGKY